MTPRHARPGPRSLAALAVAAGLAAPSGGGGEAEPRPPTFAADVAPILRENCVGCHRSGGSAPFPLTDYESARARADRMARAVDRRTMPPWLPSAEPGTYEGERRLDEDEIRTLVEWAGAGAPAGDLSTLPPPAEPADGWSLGAPDLVVTLPAYTLPADARDVYRNLVVPIPVDGPRWVEAVDLRPGNRRIVHHARVMVDPTASSRELAGEDPEPGFDGMELRSGARNPDGHFVGWTPGKVLLPPLEGMAWRLEPGTDLVAQLHLRPTGEEETVQAEVGFWFTEAPPTRHPAILVVSSMDIDIPPGEADYRTKNAYTLPVPVDVLSVYPHAHYLGKHLRAVAVLPDGRERVLIDIPDWDFDWQEEYRFAEPVRLPAGTIVEMEFSYDNSADNPHNPADPPVRVVYGSGSTDEMADLILQVLPRSEDERRRLLEHQAFVHDAEDMQYMARHRYADGMELLAAGRAAEAIPVFQDALQYRSDHAPSLVALGAAFLREGNSGAAVLIGRQAVAVTGGRDAPALASLARALAAAGDPAGARETAEAARRVARDGGLEALADSMAALARSSRDDDGPRP